MSENSHAALEAQLEALPEKVFAAGAEECNKRGCKHRVGYGTRPAIIHIDMANAWTRPGHNFTCKNMDVIIPACQNLNATAHANGVSFVFTTTTTTTSLSVNNKVAVNG